MPASADLLDLQAISKNFNRLLRMNIHRISDSKLTILIEAHRVKFASLCQKKSMEFSCSDLLESFSIKVGFVIFSRFNPSSSLIAIKDLTVLTVIIPVFTKLEACILAYSIDEAISINKALMLKAK